MKSCLSTTSCSKRRIYFNEFNVLMGNVAYLPLISGLLCAYSRTSKKIESNYSFAPFLFCRDTQEKILEKYHDPAVMAFSVYMWNEQLNLHIAEKVKQRYQNCLIIFGGAHVPFDPENYFKKYPFIDVAVRGEGEKTFSDILLRAIDSNDFTGIPGISWRDKNTGQCIINSEEFTSPKDLDEYPSPYLEGLYESIFDEPNGLTFQAIIETNRGCSFNCSYCFWGQGGLSTKWRFHSLDRVKSEIQWCAEHKIKYVFNADSNFGMHKRDKEIASFLVETKRKYGYPEKFRTCFGKNTDDRIFEIGFLMQRNELEKGVTLSRQSCSEEVLKNIHRKNINMSTFKNLQFRFNEADVPVYSELILGLPGETYESWTNGIEEHLQSGLKNQLFVYPCELYPNTELASPEFKKKFGIKSQEIILTEIHGSARKQKEVQEFQEIIVATDSMPLDQWRKSAKLSWITMLLFSMKTGFFLLKYLVDAYGIAYTDLIKYICQEEVPPQMGSVFREELQNFETQLDNLLQGGGRGVIVDDYGPLYWDVEEASFLRISEKLNIFYDEFFELLMCFLTTKGIAYNKDELIEAVSYQKMKIPTASLPEVTEKRFTYNFPEYFEYCLYSRPKPLEYKEQTLILCPTDYKNDKQKYAREVVLWGRKSGNLLVKSYYETYVLQGDA